MYFFLAASATVWLTLLAYVMRLGNQHSKLLQLGHDQNHGALDYQPEGS